MPRTTATISIPIPPDLAIRLSSLSLEAHGLFLRLAMRHAATSSAEPPRLLPAELRAECMGELTGAGIVSTDAECRFRLPHIDRLASERGRVRARVQRHRERYMGVTSALRNADVTLPPCTTPPSIPKAEGKKKRQPPKAPQGGGEDVSSVAPVWPASLDNAECRRAWADYEAYRRDSKLSALKPRSVQAQLDRFASEGPQVFVTAVRASIANGWCGVFPEKGRGNRTQFPQANPRTEGAW